MLLSLRRNAADVITSCTYSDMSSFYLEYVRSYVCGYHMYRKGKDILQFKPKLETGKTLTWWLRERWSHVGHVKSTIFGNFV